MWAARWQGQTTWRFVGSGVGKLLGLKLIDGSARAFAYSWDLEYWGLLGFTHRK